MEKLTHSENKNLKILGHVLEGITKNELTTRGASSTYYLLLSIGPFLIVLFSVLSYFLRDNMRQIIDYILEIASEMQIFKDPTVIINPIVENISNRSSATAYAIVGLIITLFSSSKASREIIRTIEIIFEKEKEGIKSTIMNYVNAFIFTFLLVLSLAIFFIFFVTGDPIVKITEYLFNIDLTNYTLWNMLSGIIPIIYLFLFATIMYKAISGLGVKKSIKFKEAAIGGIVVTIGWLLGSYAFAYYIANFSNQNAIYGILGSIMILIFWFFLLVMILLIGAQIIQAFRITREGNKIEKLEKENKKVTIEFK